VADSLSWFPRAHEVPGWYLDDRVRDGVQVPARVWKAALAGLFEAVPPTERGTITAPTLVIGGGRDELLPGDEQQRLAAAIPGSQLVIYEDTGHLVLWECPERLAADLADFVRRLTVRRDRT
jgi:pimeloyl-ACP methyl ester carboxylesterase